MPPWTEFESAQNPSHGGTDPLTIPQLLAYYSVPAVSIAVIRNHGLAWSRAWGTAAVAGATPATEETLFQAASISKPVAAIASLRAVQHGLFHLDQDINTILSSWRLPPGP